MSTGKKGSGGSNSGNNNNNSGNVIENVEFLQQQQQQQQRSSSSGDRGEQQQRQGHHRRTSSNRSRDSGRSGHSGTMIPLLQQQGGSGDAYVGGGGGGGYGYGTGGPGGGAGGSYQQYPPSAVHIPAAPSSSAAGGGYYGMPPYANVPPPNYQYQYPPYGYQQYQQPQHPSSPQAQSRHHHHQPHLQQYPPQPPPPPPPQPPGPVQRGPASDATSLSMDDIENAFNSALSLSASQQQLQLPHPLKQDHQPSQSQNQQHPLMRDGGSYRQLPEQHQEQEYFQPLSHPPPSARDGGGSSSGKGYGSIGAGSGSSSRGIPPPPPPPRSASARGGNHRRTASDTPLRSPGHHRRASSSDLQQQVQRNAGGGGGGGPSSVRSIGTDPLSRMHRKRYSGDGLPTPPMHRRSLSGTDRPQWLSKSMGRIPPSSPVASSSLKGSITKPPTHRRVSSFSSIGANSVATDRSQVSIVSEIHKSSMFAGYNEVGDALMNYPNCFVHLVMDKSLPLGRLCRVPQPTQAYEEYHAVAEEIETGMIDPAAGGGICGCDCPHCVSCRGKSALLPPNYYVLSVPDDLYQRVLDDVCRSQTMPCGLFFCGHHEDVSRPSVMIAGLIVAVLFGGMAAAAVVFHS